MIYYMLMKANKRGFTLIEIIVSIALLSIISIAFFLIFTSGIIGITNAGKKSISNYTAQNAIELNISNPSNLNSNVTTADASISLIFSGNHFNVNGRKIDVTYTYYNGSKKLTTFTTN